MNNLGRLKKLVFAHVGQRVEIQHLNCKPITFTIKDAKTDHFITRSLHGLKSQVHFGSAASWTISTDGSLAIKTCELNPQEQRLSIRFLMPKVVTIYGKQFEEIGRGKYPWDCPAKYKYPNAIIYSSAIGGWCTEFCACFVDRDKTLDFYE